MGSRFDAYDEYGEYWDDDDEIEQYHSKKQPKMKIKPVEHSARKNENRRKLQKFKESQRSDDAK